MEKPQISFVPLTSAEIEEFNSEMSSARIMLFVCSAILLIALGFTIAYYEAFFLYFIDVFFGILVGFVGYKYYQTTLDLQKGEKKVSVGYITNKKHEVRTSSSGTGSSRRTETKHYYYIEMGAAKWEVGNHRYNLLSVGQKVAVKEGPISEVLLGIDVLEDVQLRSAPPVVEPLYNTVLDLPRRPTATLPLDERDVAFIRKRRNSKLRVRVLWNVPLMLFGYFALTLVLLVIRNVFFKDLLPVFAVQFGIYAIMGIWIAYNVKQMILIYKKHEGHILHNQKTAHPFKITDKEEYKRRRRQWLQIFAIEGGRQLRVSDSAYASVKSGDEVYLHQIPDFVLLGLEMPDGEYFSDVGGELVRFIK